MVEGLKKAFFCKGSSIFQGDFLRSSGRLQLDTFLIAGSIDLRIILSQRQFDP